MYSAVIDFNPVLSLHFRIFSDKAVIRHGEDKLLLCVDDFPEVYYLYIELFTVASIRYPSLTVSSFPSAIFSIQDAQLSPQNEALNTWSLS